MTLCELFRTNFPDAVRSDKDVSAILTDSNNKVITRENGGEVIAASVINKNNILMLCVSEAYRNKGIGGELLEESERIVRADGYNDITIGAGDNYITPGVPCSNIDDKSLEFFKKRGYYHSWGDCDCFDMSMDLRNRTITNKRIGDLIDGVTYRWAEINDLPAIEKCVDDAHHDFTQFYREERLYDKSSAKRALIAEKSGNVLGALIVVYGEEAQDTGSVGCTAVSHAARGRHIAKNLVILSVNDMADSGLKSAFLGYTYSGLDYLYGLAGYKICKKYFMAKRILTEENMLNTLINHRRSLHRIPEIQYDLPKTHAYVQSALNKLNCITETVAQTGILAYFDNGKPETVAFRADMDALRVTENTGAEFTSEHMGQMHACGHDGHMAMLLTFAEWVNENISSLPRNVMLVFQPSEESGAGGEQVVKTGFLKKYNVTRCFAIHVDPVLPIGVCASRPGPLMARASEIYVDIEGKAGHAAVPGAGNDALNAAIDFIYEIYDFERTTQRVKPRRIKFCNIHSGNSTNVIASDAHIMGTLRTFADEDFEVMSAKMRDIEKEITEKYGVKVNLNIHSGYPAVINDEELLSKAQKVFDVEILKEPSYLGEDFAYMSREVAGVMFKIGLGTGIPLHSAEFNFDEKALITGVELFKSLAGMEN